MNNRDEAERLSLNADDRKNTRPSPVAKKRYALEEYPTRARNTPGYNPLYDTFQPITPPHFNPQFRDRRTNVYDRPCAHYFDNEHHISSYNRNTESPTSEIEFVMDRLGGDTKRNNDLERGNQPKKSKRRHLLNHIFDILAIAITALIFGLIYLLIKPVQRGFYCDDTSIQYPNKPDTIPMWLLGVYGGIGPIVIFCIVEIWVVRPFHCGRDPVRSSLKRRRIDYLKTIIQSALLFALGIAICFLITEVGKRTIGRLRPYYITICNPNWANIQCTKILPAASGPLAVSQYVQDHTCNSAATPAALQEARLSFPSGHASYSTYAFVFLFVYFEARLVCPNIQFLKPLLQSLCIAIAFFTCLSRVTDYKHHPTDVIGGAIIGFSIAIFAAVRIGTYLWSFSIYCETEDETEKDRLPKEERIPIPGIETRQSGALRSNDQLQLEPTNYQRQPFPTRSRNGNRSIYDDGIPIQQQQSKGVLHSISNAGRRVSPGKTFDEANG